MRTAACGVALLATCLLASSAEADCGKQVAAIAGQRYMRDSEWISIDTGIEYGLITSWCGESWPVQLAADVFRATNARNFFFVTTVTTWELDVGVRHQWTRHRTRPYVGGGLALIRTTVERREFNFPYSPAFGPWINGGVTWRVGEHFVVGLDARVSYVEVSPEDFTFNTPSVNGGGDRYGVLVGYAW